MTFDPQAGSSASSAQACCQHHPEVPAIDRCAGCAEPFCHNCLVEIHGQKYCGSCKVLALKGQPMIEAATVPCKNATTAMVLGIISPFICGVIAGVIAIVLAVQARNQMKANPRMIGWGKATAGLILGILGVISNVLMMAMNAGKKF